MSESKRSRSDNESCSSGKRRLNIVLFGDSLTQKGFEDGGWVCRVANYFGRKADVFNRGFSGYNTRWALQLMKFPESFPSQCDLAVIFLGANDSALPDGTTKRQYVPPDEFGSNLKQLVQFFRSGPVGSDKTKVVIIAPPPVSEAGRAADPKEADRRDAAKKAAAAAAAAGGAAAGGAVAGDAAAAAAAASTSSDAVTTFADRTFAHTQLYAEQSSAVAKELGLVYVDLWNEMLKADNWQSLLSDGLHFTAEGQEQVYNIFIQKLLASYPELENSKLPWDFPEHGNVNEKDPALSFKDL